MDVSPTMVKLGNHNIRLSRSCGAQEVQLFTDLGRKFFNVDDSIKSANGYLSYVLHADGYTELMREDKVACGWDGESLAGFYLVDHYRYACSTDQFEYLQHALQEICAQQSVPLERVACGAQCVIDVRYQGSGLRSTLLLTLLRGLEKSCFHSLFSLIAKDNPRAMKGHMRDGWCPVREDDEFVFVWLDVKSTIQQLSLLVE